MEQRTPSPVTQAGANLTSCDLDDACIQLDCVAVMNEFGETLGESIEGQDFVAHYCGLEYVNKLQDQGKSEK